MNRLTIFMLLGFISAPLFAQDRKHELGIVDYYVTYEPIAKVSDYVNFDH